MSDSNVSAQNTASKVVSVGQVIDERYEIMKHLGTGGFAKVFKAFDRVIERDVAIKFLDLRVMHTTDDMVTVILERFRREAKLAARIPHRNVVNIFDIGQLDEQGFQPFIVMELLHGYDLEEQLVDHGPIEPEVLLPLFVDCLDALGEAHELGIVHKDLKPSNLFLSNPDSRSASLRVVDFGIAHIKGTHDSEEESKVERQGRLTATGQILGTLQYLTPEYIGSQTVTPALDVYQMALILIELLSGDRVIKTDNAFECLRIHTFGLIEIPDYLLNSPLAPVLRGALDSEYTERYANAKVFADHLSQVDASTIPKSPLQLGDGEVSTSRLLQTQSSPAIPAVAHTGNIRKPVTGDFPTEQGIVPAALLGPDEPMRTEGSAQLDSTVETNRADVMNAMAFGATAASQSFDEFAVKKSSTGLIVVSVVLLCLVAVAAVVVMSLLDKPEPTTEVAVTTPTPAPTPEPVVAPPSTPEQPTATKDDSPANAAAALVASAAATSSEVAKNKRAEGASASNKSSPAAKTHYVTVSARPSKARILLAGDFCANPCRVPVKPGDRTTSLPIQIEASGYETVKLMVSRADGDTKDIKLVRKRRSRKRNYKPLGDIASKGLKDIQESKPKSKKPVEPKKPAQEEKKPKRVDFMP